MWLFWYQLRSSNILRFFIERIFPFDLLLARVVQLIHNAELDPLLKPCRNKVVKVFEFTLLFVWKPGSFNICNGFLLYVLRYFHTMHCSIYAVNVGLHNNIFLINVVNQDSKFTKHQSLHYGTQDVKNCNYQQLGVISGTDIIAEQR